MKGRPRGRNVLPLVTTVPKAMLDALREIRRDTGVSVSRMVSDALETYLKNSGKKLEVTF